MKVILFDGVCNLCNGWINFVIRRDPQASFQFASLQSEAGQRLLAVRGLPAQEMTSLYLVEDSRVYTRSGAILRIVRHLRGPMSLMAVFLIVPPFLRDAVYGFIAKRRYQWFGKRETCRIPEPHEKGRFIA